MRKRLLWITAVLAVTACSPRVVVHRLPGQVAAPGTLGSMQDLGRTSGTRAMTMAIALKPRDESALASLVTSLHDPKDALYGQYLTPAQFAARYAPTDSDLATVKSYLAGRGLTVTGVHANHLVVDVSATATQVEGAFQVEIHDYQNTSNGSVGYSATSDPVIPDAVSPLVSAVAGLSSLNHRVSGAVVLPNDGSSTIQGLEPADIIKAYSLDPSPQAGAGQTLGLFELDGYAPSDIAAYESAFSISPGPTLSNVLVDGVDGTIRDASNAVEVSLDIELMAAVAPGAAKILVYEGPNTDAGTVDTYSQIAADGLATAVSSSWGITELAVPEGILAAENDIFLELAAQGQSLYVAAGDGGGFVAASNVPQVLDPASQPYATAVGGTHLDRNADGSYQSETTWSGWSSVLPMGGGGGPSQIWSQPFWQNGIANATNGASATMRNVPDVALDADPNTGYAFYVEGSFSVVGGTSCAAPIWAAFTAGVNQTRAQSGQPLLGFPPLALYAVAESAQYATTFHDIADGSTNLVYPAVAGYDLATGWGSMIGGALRRRLAADAAAQSAFGINSLGYTEGQLAIGGYGFDPVANAVALTCTVDSVSPRILSQGSTSIVLSIPLLTTAQSCTATVTLPSGQSASRTQTITPDPTIGQGGALYDAPTSAGGPSYLVVYGVGFTATPPGFAASVPWNDVVFDCPNDSSYGATFTTLYQSATQINISYAGGAPDPSCTVSVYNDLGLQSNSQPIALASP